MDEVVVSTDVNVSPEKAFEFLLDFPGYANYSEYLARVEQQGEGGAGTKYRLTIQWWRLSYTAITEVTAVTPPEEIRWKVLRAVNAQGVWRVDPVAPPAAPWEGSRVSLTIQYDPDSANPGVLNLPRWVSLSWVVDRAKPLVKTEATAIVERIVADLEGDVRPVDLHIETKSG